MKNKQDKEEPEKEKGQPSFDPTAIEDDRRNPAYLGDSLILDVVNPDLPEDAFTFEALGLKGNKW